MGLKAAEKNDKQGHLFTLDPACLIALTNMRKQSFKLINRPLCAFKVYTLILDELKKSVGHGCQKTRV